MIHTFVVQTVILEFGTSCVCVCVLFKIQSKLEEALNLATEFQNSLQEFINWLTLAEQSLNIASPPSLILNTVLSQIEEHKVTMIHDIAIL